MLDLLLLQVMTVLLLIFLWTHSYDFNTRNAEWKERAVFTWASPLWITSFHTPGSTMMTNKRNMAMESVVVLFLDTQSDESNVRRCISEANEHTYGTLREEFPRVHYQTAHLSG